MRGSLARADKEALTMNKHVLRFLLPALLIASIAANPLRAVAAEPLGSGEGLLEACEELGRSLKPKGGDQVFFTGINASICWGFMGAMQRVANYGDPVTQKGQFGACLPPESSLTQLIRVFTAFAKAHPQRLHEQPDRVVIEAFQSAFPC
jgi:hypothetical protein